MIRFFLALLVLVGCGYEASYRAPGPSPLPKEEPGPMPPSPGRPVVTVKVFGAPWCSPCKAALPEVDRKIKASSKRDFIKLVVYVITGVTPSSPPSDDITRRYVQHLGLNALPVSDYRWAEYRRYFGGAPTIPAGVVEGAGQVYRYAAGMRFEPGAIVSQAERLIK